MIDHALLIDGVDARQGLLRPTKKELEVAGAEFALSYLGSEQRIEEFFNCHLIAAKGGVYITKTVLFPTRFIYLERTGKIAGNDVSYQYYLDNFLGDDAELVKQAYQWRIESVPDSMDEIVELLDKGIFRLYHQFIDIYVDCMDRHGEENLASQLRQWKQKIASP